jgi:cyclophilin family peptidyl-prolyl cis-trans isomerase
VNTSIARLGRRLLAATVLVFAFASAARLSAENNPGIVVNGPLLKEGFTFPEAFDFDATPAPAPINFAPALEVPSATGSYARMRTTLGDIFIEFVNGAPVGGGDTAVAADATVKSIKSFLATGTAADKSANSYDGVFFHRAVVSPSFSIIQSGGYKLAPGLNVIDVAPKTTPAKNWPLKNQFLAANTRGTLAMARTSNPDSATTQWFINLADNSEVFGTDNTGGYTVFARILGDGIKVAEAIGNLPTWGFNPPYEQLPLRGYTGKGSPALSQFLYVKTFREVPASAVPAAIRTPAIRYSIFNNTNPAAVSATVSLAGELTLRPGQFGGRSEVTMRAELPSGHHWDHVVTTTKLGPPVIVKAPAATASGHLGNIITLRAEATGWPFHIKWQHRASPVAEWQDLVEDSEDEPSLFVGTDTQNLQIYLYGQTTEEAAASFALSGTQFRYVVSNSSEFTAPRAESGPITFTVTTSLAFRDTLAKTTTAALGSTVSLTARATEETLPEVVYQWERLAPGSTVWEPLQNARAAVPANGDTPEQPAVFSPYSGVTTHTLTIRLNGTTPASGTGISTAATLALDKSQYRCVIRHDRGSDVRSLASNATTLRITTQKVGFAAQPPALVARQLGSNATISVTTLPHAASTPPLYRWQRLPAGANPRTGWVDVVNSTEEAPTRYTGATTRTLTINLAGADDTAKLAALALNDDQYRCILTVPAVGTATSTAARLRVFAEAFTLVTQETRTLPGLGAVEGRAYSVAGLPRGLSLDPATGAISGTPTAKPGIYKLTVTTRDGGVVTGTQVYYLEIRALSGNNAGGFEALLEADSDSPPAAKFALLISSNGAFTGTLTTAVDKSPLPFRGSVVRSVGGGLSLAAPIDIKRPGAPSGRIYRISELTITPAGVLSVTLSARDSAVGDLVEFAGTETGVRLHPFSTANRGPWANVGSYNFALTAPEQLNEDEDKPFPAGSGYAIVPVTADGRLSFRGKLADGTKFTALLAGGTDRSFRLFLRPYGAAPGAYLSAYLPLTVPNPSFPRHSVRGSDGEEVYWQKPPLPKSANYRAGFGPLGLTAKLEPWYPEQYRDLGIVDVPGQGRGEINLEVSGIDLGQSASLLPNKLSVRYLHPNAPLQSATSPDVTNLVGKLDTRTGLFSGSFFVSDPVPGSATAVTRRKVPFEGTFFMSEVQQNGTVNAEGFILLPSLPGAPEKTTTSGRVRLRQPGTPPAP